MIQLLYETKKQLKENVGNELDYIETSFLVRNINQLVQLQVAIKKEVGLQM